MTEERKHAILYAATLISAEEIIDALDAMKPNPAKDSFVERAIKDAAPPTPVNLAEGLRRLWAGVEGSRLASRVTRRSEIAAAFT